MRISLISITVLGLLVATAAALQKPAGGQAPVGEPIRKSPQEEAERRTTRISSVSELLDQYAAHQDKLNSFFCQWEASTQTNAVLTQPPYRALSGKSQKGTWMEARCDGSRYGERRSVWGNVKSAKDFIRKERAPYNSDLWDGGKFFHYVATMNWPGRLIICADVNELPESMRRKHKRDRAGLNVPLIRGFYPIDDERMDAALRRAQTVSLGAHTERINGSDCYSIEAENSSRKYMVWFDPGHGYHIAKGQVQYKDSGLFVSQENRRFEKIDGLWMIAEAVVRRIQKFRNGDSTDDTTVYKLVEMKINPDHERLGSFRPDDIVTGTTVLFEGEAWKKTHADTRIASGRMRGRMRAGVMAFFDEQGKIVSYTWRDGKIVDENGNLFADFLDKDTPGNKNDAKR